MKTHNDSHTLQLSALSEQIRSSQTTSNDVGLACLRIDTTQNGWSRLLPAGHFKAVDGRPFDVEGGHWFLDEQTGLQLIAIIKGFVNDLVIDYEHQTLETEKNGKPAPAAGWVIDEEWRADGLWIKVNWTQKARNYIEADEYRYLSAVFPYDKNTGKPLYIHSIALVNRPGLDNVGQVSLRAQLSLTKTETHPEEENAMDPILKALFELLGLPESTTQEVAVAALKQLQTDKAASDAALTALKANPATATIDPAQYVPVSIVKEMQGQLAALSAQAQTDGLDKLINEAKADGRLLPSMEPWARDLGKSNIAALKTFLDSSQPIAALKDMQAGSETPLQDLKKDVELDEGDMAVLKATGLTKEQYLAARA